MLAVQVRFLLGAGILGGSKNPELEHILRRPTDPRAVSTLLPLPFEWCAIPAGKVALTDDRQYEGTAGGIFDVPAFSMAKYPVTNAQFQVFAAEDYADAQWWNYSASASAWREQNQQPDAPIFGAAHPCVNISWYEAVAFCQWLNARPSVSRQVTLPTEQQWQRAAQGDDQRIFPWGNDFDAQKCNTLESGVGQTTPVTEYPQGTSPFGVVDMSGNAWEWCLTEWGHNRIDLSSDAPRCGRGGAYRLVSDDARVSFRCGVSPFSRISHVGFRLALLNPGSGS